MTINKTIGRGDKGSRYWIQQLVNNKSKSLNKELSKIDSSIQEVKWISPLETDNMDFWPQSGPYWDAVGIDNNGYLILVECKAHRAETRSSCRAISTKSKSKIREAMKSTCNEITGTDIFPENVWFNEYYQMATKFCFLHHLNKNGIKVKLLFLNIIDDPTFIRTTIAEWERHYNIIFNKMFEKEVELDNVIILNYK